MSSRYDAVVVGAGTNDLAAAITLAQHDLRVLVVERASTVGGAGLEALTLPGFVHNTSFAIRLLGMVSLFCAHFRLSSTASNGSTRRWPWPTHWTTARQRC